MFEADSAVPESTADYDSLITKLLLQFFFRKYCESVQSRLNNFQEHLGHTLDKQKSNVSLSIAILSY